MLLDALIVKVKNKIETEKRIKLGPKTIAIELRESIRSEYKYTKDEDKRELSNSKKKYTFFLQQLFIKCDMSEVLRCLTQIQGTTRYCIACISYSN